MDFNSESLDMALEFLLPDIYDLMRREISVTKDFNRPKLISIVAERFFSEYDDRSHHTYRHYISYKVVRAAKKDLNTLGYFDYGEEDIKEYW